MRPHGTKLSLHRLFNPEDTWPARLLSALNRDHKMSQPVRVINAGVSGYSARQIADAV